MEIIKDGEVKKLIVSGEATEQVCAEQWENIVRKNYETNGGYDYLNYVDIMSEYGFLIAEYISVKTKLLKLITLNLEIGIVFMGGNETFVQDEQIIAELKDEGYRIDTSSADKYAETISIGLRRVDNLLNRMKMKSDELDEMVSDQDQEVSFDSIMAFLYSQFPHVPEDVTLSRYNELVKIVKQRNKQKVNG